MSHLELSRRAFAKTLGLAVPAALALPESFLPRALAVAPAAGPMIKISSNENPYGPSPKALAAMSDSQRIASRYPDAAEGAMIETIARHHGVQPENVVLGCGSGDILRVADQAFLRPGQHVVVAEPTFEAVLTHARVNRAESVKVPLTADHRHDLVRMAAACADNTGLVYVCNPNNPTGTIVSRDEMAHFLERVPPTTVVLLDEAYHHFVLDPAYSTGTPSLIKTPNLVVVRTFSKVFGMAGMRLGYALATPENAQAMRQYASYANANIAVLEAAMASLTDDAHVADQRARNQKTRDWLCGELTKDGRAFIPSHANFMMIDVKDDVQPIIQAFRERGIMVGRKFPSLGHWLRVSIGTPEQMQSFLAGLRAVVPASGRAA